MIIHGKKCCLTNRKIEDFDWFWYWQNHGSWLLSDAPWEHQKNIEKDDVYKKYLNRIEQEEKGKINRLWILVDDEKIGSVSAYDDINGNSIKIGIGIYNDNYQGKGIGTNAIRLWMDYLFSKRKYHKIGLDTYLLMKK